jgi:hypothetical protein
MPISETLHNLMHPSERPNTDAAGQPISLPRGTHVKQDLNDPDLTGNPSQSALEHNQQGGGGGGGSAGSERTHASMMREAEQALGFGGGGTARGAARDGDYVIPGGSGEKLVGK